jgi:serine/threonine protein kinase
VRYGGFAERFCLSETGSWELAIEDLEGRLVPDWRVPTFRLPEWVGLPAFLEPHLAARNSVKADALPYRIERALHFSNGGGLYVGQHIQTGKQVVLKEARPHAGLDMDGTDAVARLHREREILERLAGLDTVPAVHDSFTLGEHHFLALEFVDANPLNFAIVERYPLVLLDADERAIAEYTSWALEMQARVERAVQAIHDRGVVIGDLHPFNVLLRPDGRVVLVDFEIAAGVEEGRRQTLADPGFAAPRDRAGFDIDRYALACLRLFWFLLARD